MVNGIYYNINGDNATVTYKRSYTEYNSYYNVTYTYYENDYIGVVIIPETVTYNGKTYLVTTISDHAFYNRYSSDGLTGISIPNSITSIGEYAFYQCAGLKCVTIPVSVKSINAYTFAYCRGLSNMVINDSITIIGNYAFQSCSSLSSFTIGKSVISIGQSAINGCPLSYITCLAAYPPSSSGSANTSAKLYVPLESVELYRTTSGWNYFTDVRGFGENYFQMPDFTTLHGDTLVIPVSMENTDEITAFQTDLYLPEGFELVEDGNDYLVELSNRKGRDHVIMANEMPDGAIRVLSYSPTLKTFSGNDGELFYLTVKVPEDADGNYTVNTNTFATINLNCICAIRCIGDTTINNV